MKFWSALVDASDTIEAIYPHVPDERARPWGQILFGLFVGLLIFAMIAW